MGTDHEIPTYRRDIPALTGVRFLAALYVVMFHAWPIFMPLRPGGLFWNQFLSLGYTAVSFFFVLSGFILTKVYFSEGYRLEQKDFWLARFARIYPIYIVSLIVSAPFALIGGGTHGRLYHLGKTAFLILSNGLLLGAWHPALSGNWNRPVWSVSVEAFFYLVFPVLGAWIWKRDRGVAGVAAACWILGVGCTILTTYSLRRSTPSLPTLEVFLFNPLLRLPEFVIGICCGRLSMLRMFPTRRYYWLGSLAALCLVPYLDRLPWLVVSNGLLAPIFGLIIMGLSESDGPVARVLGSRPFVRLGHASFSLYLLHLPVMSWMSASVIVGRIVSKAEGKWPFHRDMPWSLGLFLGLSVGLSLLSYEMIETPMRRTIRNWFRRRDRRESFRSGQERCGSREIGGIASQTM